MRSRPILWCLISLLCLGGAVYFWRLGDQWAAQKSTAPTAPVAPATQLPQPRAATTNHSTASASTAPMVLLTQPVAAKTNVASPLAHRLSNTPKTIGQLLRNDHAILLENALIDTARPLGFVIPENLRGPAEPGSYIVQARGPVNDAFRAALAVAGASVISYIPNNAYLVRASAANAQQLAGNPQTQSVLPYDPAYKLKSSLFALAMEQRPLPLDASLNVMVFADARAGTVKDLQQLGAKVLAESPSPFGPVLTVEPPAEDWTSIARLAGVELVEMHHRRVSANDLSRQRLGVATDATTTTNYLNLTGANVLVGVNDTGVDATHPDLLSLDLSPRVTGILPASLTDTDGHGTHVAGIIAGNGLESITVSNAQGSINPGTNFQYRGKAPAAKIFSQNLELITGPASDFDLQQNTARTNAFISNNSWHYGNDNAYDIGAASFDAAVRDALPGVTGSQPTLYVFAAGNSGFGNDSGLSGDPESIQSPGTAKNVITVGALELARNITNEVTELGSTNKTKPWQGMTSSDSQVAWFSSRGNVGIGVEGVHGRFKPDVVSPGTFVVSTRSAQWDEQAYYNPTNHQYDVFRNLTVASNDFFNNLVFVPNNAVSVTISVLPNVDSPNPLNLPIFANPDNTPAPPDSSVIKTNQIVIPPDLPLVPGAAVFYSVGNPTSSSVSFNILIDVVTTNDLGDYFQVYSNLNNSIQGTPTSGTPPHYYRYESGTSMSAADVSGTLALMQEFFEQRLRVTNSPALYKALLINGARSAGSLYSLQVNTPVNYQGWGLPNLPNSIPAAILTNGLGHATPSAIQMFDQSPVTALATDQRQTRYVILTDTARTQPLRVTLVWTDPPGNPAASVKLVNDLDLIVTNLDTGDVYIGNDIPAASNFNSPAATNVVPNLDVVNNVENVYLSPNLGTNYSVTVVARRVNVNAVTAQTNNVRQDYALVISSGNGDVTDAITVKEQPVESLPPQPLSGITNSFANSPGISGSLIFNQRVGANPQLLGTTNGIADQWHFYVLTNTTDFTNAAFVTFLPPTLAVPRMGVTNVDNPGEATRIEADIDLYVSTDPGLLLLDPNAIANADKSRRRGGTELVVYSNSQNARVYYVGVKSEDQMAAEYSFLGVFSQAPFSSTDSEGNQIVNGVPLPSVIPDGSPADPGTALVLGIATIPMSVRTVIVTNSLFTENLGDLLGNLSHEQQFAVLNNHRGGDAGYYTFVYDDSGENADNPAFQPTDGPGSLRNFVGEEASGVWLLAMVDNSLSQTGIVTGLTLKIAPGLDTNGVSEFDVAPNSFGYVAVDVPVGATNLEICVANLSANKQPLGLYVRRGSFPTLTVYDYFAVIPIIGGCLNISTSDLPPLQPGRYYIGVFNPSGVRQRVRVTVRISVDLAAIVPVKFDPVGNEPLLDDAVTYSSIFVTNTARIAQAEVALRINHPRISDLAITLISPRGTRVLLMENRGMATPDGVGSTLFITNVVPVSANGDALPQTNSIDTGATVGTLTVDYNFFQVPDRMTIYYQNAQIYDTGLISGAGRFTVNYGPGTSTLVTFIMNENGDTNRTTAWNYTVSSISDQSSYLIFTENTNHNGTPIKFVPPPFVGPAGTNFPVSDFESPTAAGNYVSPLTVDGWSVLTPSPVTVVTNPAANTGVQSLALRSGQIQRTLPTIPGRNYRLSFAYRKTPGLDPTHWWPGNLNPFDIVGEDDGTFFGGVTATAPGKVAQAFNFTGPGQYVAINSKFPFHTTNDATLQFWLKTPASGVNYQSVFWTRTDTSDLNRFNFYVANDSTFSFDYRPPGGGGFPLHALISGVPIPRDVWTHLAITRTGNLYSLYRDGAFVTSTNDLVPDLPTAVGWRFAGQNIDSHDYIGNLDEVALFDRALSPAEIQSIYDAGTNGMCGTPSPPAVCGNALGARIFVPGSVTNFFLGNNTWQTGGLLFTATASNTVVGLAPISGDSGVLVDTFALTESAGSLYALPEQFLKSLEGESAFGEWKLEVWDNRAGATNPAPTIVNWQLQLVFQSTKPVPTTLLPGLPSTNSVPPGQVAYFVVDVPAWAQFATNTLLFASGPLNVLFNQNTPPAIGATNAGDFLFFGPVTTGSATLSTNTAPPLQPGRRYYLGVHNPSTTTTVQFALQVDFDITALTNRVPLTSTLDATGIPRYFLFDVSTNATAVAFQLLNLTGDANLVARYGAPLPTLTSNDYGSFNFGTADEDIIVFTNSTPVPLAPGRWYLGVFNASIVPVTYTILASEFTNVFPNIITLTNGIPYFNTNNGFGRPVDYYRYVVSPTAARAQFEINNPSGNMALAVRKGLPLPNLGLYDYRSNNPLTNDELIVIFTNSAPVPLTPGEWFLSAANISGGPVSYAIKATEWPVTGQPIVITNITTTSNEFCITWTSLPGVHYYVQGLVDLNSPDWVTISPTITATDYFTTYCIPLPSPFQFFRVQEGLAGVIGSGFPAFPGAEGAGGFAVGGRTGDVYHVTTLLDSGPGSLRQGVTAGNRTIVFDLSGTITLLSDLKITNSYLTIAGQTAPGDGITLRGRLTSVQNAHDVVVRFLRFRPGDVDCPAFQDDAFHFDNTSNSIVDHVSASWSIDETLSVTDSTNITVQWSLITESLNASCHIKGLHGYGSLLRYGYGSLSVHHNLYADNSSRNPRLGDNLRLDFVNNVIYNWGIKAGYNGEDTVDNPAGFTNRLNYVGNYLIAGTSTSNNLSTAFESSVTNAASSQIYQSGNLMDSNLNGLFDGTDTGWGMFANLFTQAAGAFAFVPVTTDAAPVGNERVLAFGGASQTRDAVDLRVVGAVRTQTGAIIDSQAAVGGWPPLASTTPPLDTDQDGIPDYWEITLGQNPLVPNNNDDRDGDGYTDLEEYNNWLAAPHALTAKNTPVNVDLRGLSGNTGNFTFTVANGANGTVTLLPDGRTARFTPAINYSGFAAFSFSPVNTNTGVAFGPVPVSVMINSVGPTVPGVITLTNAIAYASTNQPAVTNIDYYRFVVSSNSVRAQFEINNPTGDLTLVARKGLPLPNLATFDYRSTNSYTNDELIVVFDYSSPVPLAPGDWYLAAVNISGGPVAYSIKATEWPVYGTNLNPVAFVSSNSFCLTWNSLIGVHYIVSGRSNLSVTNWDVISPTITATTTQTTWCALLPTPYQFFRVTEGLALSTNLAPVLTPPAIGSVTAATNGFLLQWTAPTIQQFRVQWATNLPPVPWMTFSNTITSTNGQFSFFDDGTQTGGSFGPFRFYRLQLLP